MRPDSPAVTREQPYTPLPTSKGELISLRQHNRFPDVPAASREPKLPATTLDKRRYFLNVRSGPIPCRALRRIPEFSQKLKRRLDSFYARGSMRYLSNREEPPFSCCNQEKPPCSPLHLEMRVIPLLLIEMNPDFLSHLNRRSVSPIETEWYPPQFLPQIERTPRSPSTQDKAGFS